MKLIIGLGNPGRSYINNRHNVGFQCLDFFARKHRISLSRRLARARFGFGKVDGVEVLLAKPQTYMNNSGEAVSLLKRSFSVPLEDIIVIYDDMDLPLGKIRIRQHGSSGGHKGVKSIITHLGSHDFPRIRVGIGRIADAGEAETYRYLLSDFTAAEKAVLRETQAMVAEAILCLLTEGIVAAMNCYN